MKAFSCLLLLVLLLGPAQAQSWIKASRVLIVPGKAAGVIALGKPISSQADKLYGKPSSVQHADPGPGGRDTGSVVYGPPAEFELKSGFLVKLNDGKGDANVYVIYLRGVRAYTAEGATMGQAYQKTRAIYPHAQLGIDELGGGKTLAIPGLTMVFSNQGDKLVEMIVRSK